MSSAPVNRDGPSLATTLVLGAIGTFGGVAIEMYLPALSLIAAELKSPAGGIELTISAFLVALAGGQLVYGPLSDRFGRRTPLLCGMILFCIASAACAFATNVDQLIAARFMQGLGACAGPVIVRAIVRDRYPPSRVVHVLANLSLVQGLAPLLAPLAGGAILASQSWRAILWTQAAFGVIVSAVTLLTVKEPKSAQLEGPRTGLLVAYGAVISNPRVLAYTLTAAFGGSVIFIYGALFPAIGHRQFGLTAQQLSLVFAAGGGVMWACAQLNRPLLCRFSSDQILQGSNLLSLCVAIVLCIDAWTGLFGLVGLVGPIFLLLGLRGTSMPHASASTLLAENRHIGIASAMFGAASFGGGALMSALAARLVDGTARPMAGTILLALVLAALPLRFIQRENE